MYPDKKHSWVVILVIGYLLSIGGSCLIWLSSVSIIIAEVILWAGAIVAIIAAVQLALSDVDLPPEATERNLSGEIRLQKRCYGEKENAT